MRKITILIAFLIPLCFIMLAPLEYSFAQQQGVGGDAGQQGEGGDVPAGNSITLDNPLRGGNIDSIPKLIEAILDIALTIGVPIIALAIIYAGYLFVAAQGNPEKLKKAKDTIVWVVIGAAILLGAYAIAKAIVSTITAIRG